MMIKIPCAKHIPFIVTGLSFLQPALTNIQFNTLILVATALVLGAKLSLTQISRMWLEEKCVSSLSHFFSHAKFSTNEMQHLYALQVMRSYKIEDGYYLIDDTMEHHTTYCKWIHGVFVLFDHVFKTNLRAKCVVVLYYSDGGLIKFPITHRLYYKDTDNMPWQNGKKYVCKAKYDLGLEMLQWALDNGFPRGTVLTDSWFANGPFIKGLKQLKMAYVLEIANCKVRVPFKKPKLTSKGKLAKKQFELVTLPEFFKTISMVTKCGFGANKEKGKKAKDIFHTKIATVRLNSIVGKHRIVESIDPAKQTTKYLLTDQLTWEATKIISVYSNRWVIEEFFRNAKQLTDMEGATIRSEQGVTLALSLVSWIDYLFHYENYKQSTAGELSKEPLTIPSIVRQAEYENFVAVFERMKSDEDFRNKWLDVVGKHITRKRKEHKVLINLGESREGTWTRLFKQ